MCESGWIRLEWGGEGEIDYVMEAAENSITEIMFAHTIKSKRLIQSLDKIVIFVYIFFFYPVNIVV